MITLKRGHGLLVLLAGLFALHLNAWAEPVELKKAPVQTPDESSALTGQIVYEVLLGEIAALRGDLGLALQAYSDVSQTTQNPELAKRAAEIALFYGKDLSAATSAAKLWLQTSPDSAEAKRLLAKLEEDSKTQLAALEAKVVQLLARDEEKRPNNLMSLNAALARIGDAHVRRGLIERVTSPYLNISEALFSRAQAQAADRDESAALATLDAALLRSHDWEPAVLYKAQLQNLENPERSISQLEAYLTRHPGSQDAKIEYSRVLAMTGQGQEALNVLQALLSQEPDNADIRYACAMLAVEIGDFSLAQDYLERLLGEKYKESDAVRIALAQIAERTDQYATAERWLRSVENPQFQRQLALRIAYAMAKQDRLAEAKEYLASQPPEDGVTQSNALTQAQLLKQLKFKKEAFELAQVVAKANPNNPGVLYEYAMIAEAADQLTEMETALRTVIKLRPEDAHAKNALGYSWIDRNIRLEEGGQLIEQALKLAPDNAFILDSQAWYYMRKGQPDRALPLLQKALRLRPDPEVVAHLSAVLCELARKDEARGMLLKSLRANPNSEVLKETLQRLEEK